MCRVSDQLKLCTCAPDAERKHYWVFYRYRAGEPVWMVGEIMPAYEISKEADLYNRKELIKILNKGDAFDTDLHPEDHDRLALHFQIDDLYIDYGFRYEKGKWRWCRYDSFDWVANHEQVADGVIRDGGMGEGCK